MLLLKTPSTFGRRARRSGTANRFLYGEGLDEAVQDAAEDV